MRRIHHVGDRRESAGGRLRLLPRHAGAAAPQGGDDSRPARAGRAACRRRERDRASRAARPSSGIGRFLARRGEGLHHVCFDTPDIVKTLTSLKEMRVELLDAAPRPGLAGQIAFVHPKACCGVLVELATPSAAMTADLAAPLRLKRLVIGASDVKRVERRAPVALRPRGGGDERRAARDAGGRPRCAAGGAGRGGRRHRGAGRALDGRRGLSGADGRLRSRAARRSCAAPAR